MSRRTNGVPLADHLDGERRPVDPGQPADAEDRGGHPGAGVAGGHHGVGLAAPDEVAGDEDRGVLLLSQGQGRVLVHVDDLRCRHDVDVRWEGPGDRTDAGFVADEQDPVLGVSARMVERAGHDLVRSVIAAHRVDREPDPGARPTLERPSGWSSDQDAGSSFTVFISRTGRPP